MDLKRTVQSISEYSCVKHICSPMVCLKSYIDKLLKQHIYFMLLIYVFLMCVVTLDSNICNAIMQTIFRKALLILEGTSQTNQNMLNI